MKTAHVLTALALFGFSVGCSKAPQAQNGGEIRSQSEEPAAPGAEIPPTTETAPAQEEAPAPAAEKTEAPAEEKAAAPAEEKTEAPAAPAEEKTEAPAQEASN